MDDCTTLHIGTTEYSSGASHYGMRDQILLESPTPPLNFLKTFPLELRQIRKSILERTGAFRTPVPV